MYIFQKKPNGRIKEIYGPGDLLIDVSGAIVDEVGIGSCCNMSILLCAIAEYKIPSPKGYGYCALVEGIDPGTIEIFYCLKSNIRSRLVSVAQIEADKMRPEIFKKDIMKEIILRLVGTRVAITKGIEAIGSKE